MPTIENQFFFDSAVDDQAFSGEVDIRKLSEAAPAANTATKMTWSVAGVQTRTVRPLQGTNTTNSDTTINNGWAFNNGGADGLVSTADTKRLIPAGDWVFRQNVTINAPALLQTIAATSIAKVYRVATGGGSRTLLFTTGASNNLSATGTATITFSASEILLEPGEVILVGFTWSSQATTALFGAVTPTVVTVNLGTGSDVVVPTGVRTLYGGPYGSPTAESLPAVDSLGRVLHAIRDRSETVEGTDLTTPVARAIKTGRGLSESIPTVDSIDRKYGSFRGLSESIPIGADSVGRFFKGGRANSESVPTTSTLAAAFKGDRSITESIITSDAAPARFFKGGRGLSESVPTTHDVPIRVYRAQRTASESIPTTDSVPARLYKGGRVLQESIPTVDAVTRLIKQRRFLEEYPTGVSPDYAVQFPTRKIAGIVKTSDGTPYEGATVKLFREQDDKMVQATVSAADGSYEFLRDEFDPYIYFVVAYEETGTPTQGLTIRNLSPVSV